jgi:hypothetical protein
MAYQSKREKYIIQSSIHSALLTTSLKRGTVLGGGGALLLILGGTILPLEMLSLWGIPFFLLGIFFIALGLLPYRKLTQLQLKPHEIHYDGETLHFLKQGKPLFTVASMSIEKIAFVEKEHLYGLGIWLKKPIETKVKVLQPHFNFAAFVTDSMHRFEGCDLFLPFFSEHACKELISIKDQLE